MIGLGFIYTTWGFPILVVAFVLAVVLVVLGLLGRPVGGRPHCAACHYELTGTQSNRCPECGARLTGSLVLAGVVRRRRLVLCCGLVLGLATVGATLPGAYRWVTGINKYDLYRVPWLVDAARTGSIRAFDELKRRCQRRLVVPDHADEVAAAAFELTDEGDPAAIKWLQLLHYLNQHKLLGESDRNGLFLRMREIKFTCRRSIRAGDPLPVAIERRWRPIAGMNRTRTFHNVRQVITIDGRTVELPGSGHRSWRRRYLGGLRAQPEVKRHLLDAFDLSPGEYTVECKIEDQCFDRSWFDPSLSSPAPARAWTGTFQFEAPLTVLPADADDIRFVSLPKNSPPMVDWFLQSEIHVSTNGSTGTRSVHAVVSVGTPTRGLPVGIAFNVFLQHGDKYVDLGEIARPRNDHAVIRLTAELHSELQRPCYLVFSADADVARRSVDVVEIWNDNLTIGPLEPENIPIGVRPADHLARLSVAARIYSARESE